MAIDIDLTIKTVRLYDSDFTSDKPEYIKAVIGSHILQQFDMGFIPSTLIASDVLDVFKLRFIRMKDVSGMPIYAPSFVGVPKKLYHQMLENITLNWSRKITSKLSTHFRQGVSVNAFHRFIVLPDNHSAKWDDIDYLEEVEQTLSVERILTFSSLSSDMQSIIEKYWHDKSNNGRVVRRKLVVLSHSSNHRPIPGDMEIIDLAGFSHSRYS